MKEDKPIKTSHVTEAHDVKKPNILRRILLLFFIIVSLFSILLVRLAYMQITNHAFYMKKLQASTVYRVKSSRPRGKIYDSQGKMLVSNAVLDVVSFTRSQDATAKTIKSLAKDLSQYVRYSEQPVSLRAQKDYYLADPETYQKVVKALPHSDKYDKFGNKHTEATIYKHALHAIPKKALNYSTEELKIIAVFNQMNHVPTFNTVSLKTKALTEQEIAYLVANKDKLPGISVSSDWNRRITDSSLASIIGKVSSQEAGLPQEEAQEYLKRGYSLNDRVGTSYLEKAYEKELQGQHEIREIKTNKENKVVSDKVIAQGQAGQNLELTISTDFQNEAEAIVTQRFNEELSKGIARYSDGAYAVALNPKTGAILAMVGLDHNPSTGALQKNALGTITNVFTPGSVVKGATLAAGWQTKAINGNQVLTDQPIQFGNSKPINSWFTVGQQNITAVQALEYSSNTYMVQVALKMMGQEYHTGMALMTKGTKETMDKLRATYAEFGLGTATGIDLPGESKGYLTKDYSASNVITEAFGQYDNYTPMQLAQYAATVANGGKRLAPHLVAAFYQNDGSDKLGKKIKEQATHLLNKVNLSAENMALIQEGFYQVVNSSSPYATGKYLAGGPTVISAKTGTAETTSKDNLGNPIDTFNLNVVAYGPSADPQIAVAIMYPHTTDALAKAHELMAKDIINLYMTKYANK